MRNESLNSRPARPRTLRSARTSESGQTLMETALLLPMLLLLLVGVIEVGRLAYVSIAVCGAARAGVQYGAQSESKASDTSGMQNAATLDGVDISGMTATATHYCQCSDGTSTACTNNTCSTSTHLVEFVQVNTRAEVNSLFKYPGIPQTFTLNSSAVMRVAQ